MTTQAAACVDEPNSMLADCHDYSQAKANVISESFTSKQDSRESLTVASLSQIGPDDAPAIQVIKQTCEKVASSPTTGLTMQI